ncbi:nitronate monooxygenase [Anaerolineales bacterium]
MQDYPQIIQGGMGVAVSSWQLANAVSREGQLGVVSGTGIGLVLIGRLMQGDPGGYVQAALADFPIPRVAKNILDKYYRPDGTPDVPMTYKRPTMWTIKPPVELVELTIAGNFVEVWLAKQGHQNPVGINLLEKVQLPNLSSLYGAMLAGVDYVIMGAGIPMRIPGALDAFVTHQAADYALDVANAKEEILYHFDPLQYFPEIVDIIPTLKRPKFLPIVSSVVLALALKRRANGEVNGFIIEMPTAGGHNAPPRGETQYNERGEPIYTEKDNIDLSKFRTLELPFWLAGGYGNAEKFQEALDEGATGIQVGTAFAFCEESGMITEIKNNVISQVLEEEVNVYTSPVASPTGFPFKVVDVPNSTSDKAVYKARPRLCDIGYLRQIYQDENGKLGYRCSSEPVDQYVKKGGKIEMTEGRMCLCNQLGSAGFAHKRPDGYLEPYVVTSGDDLPNIKQFLPEGATHYSAQSVIKYILDK